MFSMRESVDFEFILCKICQILHEKKATNILALFVGHCSSVTNYLVIAEGFVERHVQSLAEGVMQNIRERMGIFPHHVEGKMYGEWILLDYLQIIVHLFIPTFREKFRLEEIWWKGKVIKWGAHRLQEKNQYRDFNV